MNYIQVSVISLLCFTVNCFNPDDYRKYIDFESDFQISDTAISYYRTFPAYCGKMIAFNSVNNHTPGTLMMNIGRKWTFNADEMYCSESTVSKNYNDDIVEAFDRTDPRVIQPTDFDEFKKLGTYGDYIRKEWREEEFIKKIEETKAKIDRTSNY
ncbi:unnamed protein product [Caenorhabditis angaria]|uniref:Uncharacterized protein n=1 Tax=Caenorhabditis angaria TaxID=860376 RepID=A0A9P1ISC4_9PELO|nr:unnamed protein product [Caenorhabditis angaria]